MFVLAMAGLGAISAHAEEHESDASRLFSKATAAFRAGHYRTAAESFDRAFELVPKGATAYGAALAWEAAGEHARAADGFARSINFPDMSPRDASDAAGQLALLKRKLATFTVRSPAGATLRVAHVRDVVVPATFHLEPGDHALEARRSPESTTSTLVHATAGSAETLDLVFPQPGGFARFFHASTPKRAVGLGFLGLAVGGASATAVLGIQALSARREYLDSNDTDGDARERAFRYQTWTSVALAGTVVCGAVAAWLLVTSDPSDPTSVSLRVGPTSFQVEKPLW